MEIASPLQRIDWAVAQRALPGEDVSGDRHLILAHQRGLMLAVIDGCGHGPEAAKAAEIAADTLRLMPESDLLFHLHRCHRALAGSRGVVMTLAEFNTGNGTLNLCGVGNVEATLFHAAPAAGEPPEESALLRGGVVGAQLPEPFASVIRVQPGDVLIMASDGLRPDFTRDVVLRNPPQRLADHILDKNFKGSDDALVLVARFREQDDE
jgi:negative regulator of sigma-B (phosphoserine phosphatase)